MKRFHVHVAVDDLAVSKRFYAAMFGMPPTVEKNDYAKWMLDDPRLNFAISSRGGKPGVNHLGFQAEDAAELDSIHQRLQQADGAVVAEAGASCCYAKSDKYWVTDPSGVAWESFHTLDNIPTFNGHKDTTTENLPFATTSACCTPPAAVAVPFKITPPNAVKGGCCG